MEAFHGVHYVQALPAVEIPTGSAGTAQVPFQKSTQISISAEKQINNNTHAAPNTPDKPIETKTSYADYPLPLTKSALMHVSNSFATETLRLFHMFCEHPSFDYTVRLHVVGVNVDQAKIAQSGVTCFGLDHVQVPCAAVDKGQTQPMIKSFTYTDSVKPHPQASSDDPVILQTPDRSNRVKTTDYLVEPSPSVQPGGGPGTPDKPNVAWARSPRVSASPTSVRQTIQAQQQQGILPSPPTVISVGTAKVPLEPNEE